MPSLLKLKNNALGRLNALINTSATTISLVPGQGARFPALTLPGEHFPATLIADDGAIEIVDVTGRAGDVLTVVRARDGTAAAEFAVNDRIELRLTAGALQGELDRMEAALVGKADAAAVNAKADGAATATALAAKADATAVANALGSKANTTDVLAKAGGQMTGPLILAAGSLGAPGLTFAGDGETGLYRISDGVIGIVCNGVLVGRFTPAGLEVIKITQTGA